MRYKSLLVLALCLTLSGCTRTPTRMPAQPSPEATEAPAVTAAPIKGQTLSLDGKWEVVQFGVSGGITSGGLYPSETVRIVNTETGECLWEEAGAATACSL